jgi:hypothetical protein
MQKRIIALILGLVILLCASLAFADRNDKEIARQNTQINKNLAAGKLTQHEAAVLHDNLDRIRSKMNYLRDNGRYNAKSAAKIDRMLLKNNRMMQKMKNHKIERVEY